VGDDGQTPEVGRAARGIDRRAVIRTGAVAGGLVWVAPALATSRQLGRSGSPTPTTTSSSVPEDPCTVSCGGVDICATPCGPSEDFCFCGPLNEGGCTCFNPVCTDVECETNADCPTGFACVTAETCCFSATAFCAPLCGTVVEDQRRFQTYGRSWHTVA
jgi:hypothetical protein